MKTRTIVALVVAAVLILSGSLLIFMGFRNVDFDFSREAETKTYVVSDTFQSIQIDSDTCDVILIKTDGEFRAVCPDSEKLSCAVIAEDGVLKISAVDIRHWTDLISIFPAEMRVTVYLPESQYESLSVESDTGDVDVPQDFSFGSAALRSDTGDITFAATVSAQLTAALSTGKIQITDSSPTLMEISSSTGDVSVFGSSPAVLRIETSTGDIVLDEITGNCEFEVHTTTGSIQAQNVECEVMDCETTTGSITFYRVLAQGYLGLCTDTGDVELDDCDSAQVSIDTDTGDVTGNFLTPKWFLTETDTGDIRVPSGREGGECRIQTNTGDITFF